MEQGQQHAKRAEWKHALLAFNSALNLCESTENLPDAIHCRCLVLGKLGNTNRQFGRYEAAKAILEEALMEVGSSRERIKLSGELGVLYRHTNRLADAKRAFELLYDTAKEINFERAICRSIGNFGHV